MKDYGAFRAKLMRISSEISNGEFVKEAGLFVEGAAKLGAPGLSGYLKQNIFTDFDSNEGNCTATVFTDVEYAPYVELGTGPRGAADHDGISPDVIPAYKLESWWIHESQVDLIIAQMYKWTYIDTPQGRFYKCYGQPANPFMYPALKDNENEVIEIMKKGINGIMERNKK